MNFGDFNIHLRILLSYDIIYIILTFYIQYVKALKLIIDYDVEITNGMVQQFILPKEVPNRTKIMEAVAQHCYDRTQFQVSPTPTLIY